MYKILKSSNTGVDEFDIEDMEKGGVENPEYHDIYIKSDNVEVEDLR